MSGSSGIDYKIAGEWKGSQREKQEFCFVDFHFWAEASRIFRELAENGVVNEARFAHVCGYGEEGARGCEFDGLERGPVDALDVINKYGGLVVENALSGGNECAGASFATGRA